MADEVYGQIIIEEERVREDYTQIPNTILQHPDVSPGAKLTYSILLMYARKKGSCFPGQETMATDMGAGVRSVIRYLQELEKAKLIRIKRNGLNRPNTYYLSKWVDAGYAKLADQEVPKSDVLEVPNRHAKNTFGNKEALEEDSSRLSNGTNAEERSTIEDYIEDFGREFNDQASLKSSTSRAVNLYVKSNLPMDEFRDQMLAARSQVKQRRASKRMAYFFACLERLLEEK